MTTRLERGIRIIELLQRGLPQTVAQIAEKMDVSRRTIFRDIALLKEMGMPIVMNPDTSAYSCSDANQTVASGLPLEPHRTHPVKVEEWTIRFFEDAIRQKTPVIIREQDSQQSWVTKQIVPLEISFDHRGWRLAFTQSDNAIDRVEAATSQKNDRHDIDVTRGTSPRVVTLSQIQVQRA